MPPESDPAQSTPAPGPSATPMLFQSEPLPGARPDGQPNGGDPARATEPKPPQQQDAKPPAQGSPERIKIGDLETSEAELRAWLTEKAAWDHKQLTLPATAADYKAELPADLKLPEGIAFKLDDSNPAFLAARQFAHEAGLSQTDFSNLIGIYAAEKIQDAQTFNAARAAEVQKLGTNGPLRVDAVTTWLRGQVGEDLGKALAGMMWTEKAVRGFEKLMNNVTSQGAADFTQRGRDTSDSRAVSDETWNSWSFGQKQNWQRTGDPNKAAA